MRQGPFPPFGFVLTEFGLRGSGVRDPGLFLPLGIVIQNGPFRDPGLALPQFVGAFRLAQEQGSRFP